MSWHRLDDGFHSHPKTIRAWLADPAAVGLLTLAFSWAAQHEQDGHVPSGMFEMWMPEKSQRDAALSVLVEVGFLHENGGDAYVIHDYLDYNPSRADLTARREADRKRKSEQRSGGT